MDNFAIQLTPAALAHVEKQLKSRGRGVGLRLTVKDSGCSNKKYVVDFVDEVNAIDLRFEQTPDVSVFVDPISFNFVKGTVIDYGGEGLQKHFIYNNPNQTSACGCGESFDTD